MYNLTNTFFKKSRFIHTKKPSVKKSVTKINLKLAENVFWPVFIDTTAKVERTIFEYLRCSKIHRYFLKMNTLKAIIDIIQQLKHSLG